MSFSQDGYLSPLAILTPEEAIELRAKFDALEAQVGKETAQIGLLDKHLTEPFIYALATHPKVLDAVESVLGPDFFLLATHFFCKYGEGAGAEKFVAWHQDVTYWGLEPAQAVAVWLAIDDADEANGCMQVIPGSHRGGIREHGTAEQTGNLLSINQEVPVTAEEEASAVSLELKAGWASLHDGCLIHGSLPNTSDRRRCGLTLRYIPTSVRQTVSNSHGKRWSPMLVRGTDHHKYWKGMTLETVHFFISTGRFKSWDEMSEYIYETYTDDGDGIDSPLMAETGLDDYEPMCIESVFSGTGQPVPVKELLESASWSDQWLSQIEGERLADAVIGIFPPNRLAHPERCSLEYLGRAEFQLP